MPVSDYEDDWAGVTLHRRDKKSCAPPTHHAFDIDIYDCPCGHMYGDHEYNWLRTAIHPEKAMIIISCEKCSAVPA